MQAQLTIISDRATRTPYDLVPGQSVTIGRDKANTIVLEDEHASRRHAEIVHDNGKWLLKDIGKSLNGTLLDGAQIQGSTPLANGQEITVGSTRMRVTLRPEEPSIPGLKELSVLSTFTTLVAEESGPRSLIQRALETILYQTQATVAGFLSLDEESPIPKAIAPEQAQVDFDLSRQLTKRVQSEGRTVWLAGDQDVTSESLLSFSDALCVPLRTAGRPLGAIHVYRANGVFSDSQRWFCEVLAGYLATNLQLWRARRSLEAENSRLRKQAPAVEELIGSSPAMQELRQLIARVAPRLSTVLIHGESGVGKELVALALHRQSKRRDGPLVVVNCAAISATLPEAELFGHCKGAFTGADRDRPGLFQQADEGTLFLDEIGELPLDCQAKLLRVIEGKGFRPVGAQAEVHADVRIIAASNRDLEQEVAKGRFRQDLLFRLQVITIAVPPLRAHAEDVPELVNYFLGRLARESRRPVQLTHAALAKLRAFSWPGNVRQLWAVVESAVAMCDRNPIDAADLVLPSDGPRDQTPTLDLEELETWAIRQALRQTKGNVSRAAKLLGVVRDTLASKMKKKGISREDSQSSS